jgi:hypothetical protein
MLHEPQPAITEDSTEALKTHGREFLVQAATQYLDNGSASILGIVHDVEMPSLKEAESVTDVCASPLCDVRFPQTGLAIKPRRFCSDECRQQASIIRRAATLLALNPQVHVVELDPYVLARTKELLNKVGIIEFHRLIDEERA